MAVTDLPNFITATNSALISNIFYISIKIVQFFLKENANLINSSIAFNAAPISTLTKIQL